MDSETPYAFFDFPASEFPFSILALADDGEILFARMVQEACALIIPNTDRPVVRVIMVTADGEATDFNPGSEVVSPP